MHRFMLKTLVEQIPEPLHFKRLNYTPRKSTSYLLSQPPGLCNAKCKNAFCYEFKQMWKAAAMAYFKAVPHGYVTV